MYKVNELFGRYTNGSSFPDLSSVLVSQSCIFRRDGQCNKNRKSEPDVKIGTCSLCFNNISQPLLICPDRLTDGDLIFRDCLQYLDCSGCEVFLIPEVSIAVGHIDYVLVAMRNDSVVDFVGIELQTMDTTGSIWPNRQRMLYSEGYSADSPSLKNCGVNWKMTAKTILAQMVQKTQVFDAMSKKLVLVCQSPLYDYMSREFNFSEVVDLPIDGRQSEFTTYFHYYDYLESDDKMVLSLKGRSGASCSAVERIMLTTTDHDKALKDITQSMESKNSIEYFFTNI